MVSVLFRIMRFYVWLRSTISRFPSTALNLSIATEPPTYLPMHLTISTDQSRTTTPEKASTAPKHVSQTFLTIQKSFADCLQQPSIALCAAQPARVRVRWAGWWTTTATRRDGAGVERGKSPGAVPSETLRMLLDAGLRRSSCPPIHVLERWRTRHGAFFRPTARVVAASLVG